MQFLRFFFILVSFFWFACETKDQTSKMDQSLTIEIQNRLQVLAHLSHNDDSLASIYQSLHKESERLILLSRDHENPKASIKRANQYFELLSRAIPSGSAGPLLLQPNMNAKQIQLAIKQNELWLLNNLIFLQKEQGLRLFSAKD